MRAHKGFEADDALWKNDVSREYRRLLMTGALEKSEERVTRDGKVEKKVLRKGIGKEECGGQDARATGEIPLGKLLRCRVRYFTDGAVIGSKAFVNEAFASARERFGSKRKDGARRMRGNGALAGGVLWSVRDLRIRV